MKTAPDNDPKKWADFIKGREMEWEMSLGKTPKLPLLKTKDIQHEELLTVLLNAGLRDSVLWTKGLRAMRRRDKPIVDFKLDKEYLPYKVFIDDKGIAVLIELFDNNESFKIIGESDCDTRKKPILAAAAMASTVIATLESRLGLNDVLRKLMEKGLLSDEDIGEG